MPVVESILVDVARAHADGRALGVALVAKLVVGVAFVVASLVVVAEMRVIAVVILFKFVDFAWPDGHSFSRDATMYLRNAYRNR